jgi:hypothetical protein
MTSPTGKRNQTSRLVFTVAMLAAFALSPAQTEAQQKDLPEVNILTAVGNMAFSAVWVAEQLKYFEEEGIRAKITPAGGALHAKRRWSAARRTFAPQARRDWCWRKWKARL